MRCRITNAVKCLPPGNKPEPGRYDNATVILQEISEFAASGSALLALGAIAHQAVLMALGLKLKSFHSAMARFTRFPAGLRLAYQNPQG